MLHANWSPSAGDVYVADTSNHCIRLVSAGTVTTVAGTCGVPGWQDGPAASSMASSPWYITMGPSGTSVFWTDSDTCVVRRLDIAAAQVSTVAGMPRDCGALLNGAALSSRFGLRGPQGLAFYGSSLYIADTGALGCSMMVGQLGRHQSKGRGGRCKGGRCTHQSKGFWM